MKSSTRMPGLDALRGLAILLVLVRHALPDALGNAGIVGVVVFFTLSGYLITGVLMSEFDRTGSVSFKEFFRRRALRLFPPLLLLLLTFSVVELLTDRLGDRWYLGKTLITALTYTSDLPLLPISPGLGHLWTLAIEEQFYLVWPFLLVAALRRRSWGWLLVVGAAALWSATLASVLVHQNDIAHLYRMPSSWAITLLVGAAARLCSDRVKQVLARPTVFGLVGLSISLVIASGAEAKDSMYMYLVGGPAIALATVLMINLVTSWDSIPRVLEPLRLLGVISYSVYLWNYLIVCWVRGDGSSPVTMSAGLTGAFGSIAAATVSWFALERPIKNAFRSRPAAHHSAKAASVSA